MSTPADACCSPSESGLLPRGRSEQAAAVFKALADPTRVRLIQHIGTSPDGMACACHLPEALGISQPTLSHHLKKLVDAGLLEREQRGRWAHYRVQPGVVPKAVMELGPRASDEPPVE